MRILLAALTAAGLLVTAVVSWFALQATRGAHADNLRLAGEAVRTQVVAELQAVHAGLSTIRDAAMVEAAHLTGDDTAPWAADGALTVDLFRHAIEQGSLGRIRSAGLLRAIAPDELDDFEAATGIQVRPEPREAAYVLEKRYPFDTPANLLGFDLGSEPVRRATVERARDTGEVAMTSLVRLATPGNDPAIILVVPLYETDSVPATLAGRRSTFVGAVNAVIEPSLLLQEATTSQLQVALVDHGVAVDTGGSDPQAADVIAGVRPAEVALELPVDAGDRRWALQVAPGDGFGGPALLPVVTVGVAGLLLTLAVVALAQALATREARASALVAARTADLHASRDALEAANARLRAADATRTQFLVTISHELRTPLTAIRGFASLLASDSTQLTEEDRRTFAVELDRSTAGLTALLQEVLDFAEMQDEGVTTLALEIAAGIPIARAVAAQPHTHPITITGDHEATVLADPQALQRVIANLLANARSYSPAGTAITVDVVGGYPLTTIHVDDHGPGIDPDERETVFQRFHRGRVAASGSVPGTGIGLTMSRQLVTAMGGSIIAEAAPGGGARMAITLPAAHRSATPVDAEAGVGA